MMFITSNQIQNMQGKHRIDCGRARGCVRLADVGVDVFYSATAVEEA